MPAIRPQTTTPNVSSAAASAEEAIESRRSVRAFLPTPVDEATVRRILGLAARALSGTNTQPWKVHVLAGAAKDQLCDAVLALRETEPQGSPEYSYYPETLSGAVFDESVAQRCLHICAESEPTREVPLDRPVVRTHLIERDLEVPGLDTEHGSK